VPVRKVEREIEHLSALRDAPAAEALAGLRGGLADRVGLLVAKAAKIGAERQLRELVPDLLRAFHRSRQHELRVIQHKCVRRSASMIGRHLGNGFRRRFSVAFEEFFGLAFELFDVGILAHGASGRFPTHMISWVRVYTHHKVTLRGNT
jgi:hypothetical protein